MVILKMLCRGSSFRGLVSSDYKGNSHRCIIDGLSTMVMEKRMVKVMGWYDNEWGHSCRTADLAAMTAEKGI